MDEKFISRPIERPFRDKVKTNVPGFDDLLFGGFDLTAEHTVVAIKSDEPIQGTLLSLQMLYGVTQSLQKAFLKGELKRDYTRGMAHFISSYSDDKGLFLNDILLDTLISTCIQKMIEKYVETPKQPSQSIPDFGSRMTGLFFDMESKGHNSDCTSYRNIDALICEEAVLYSNRTNCLHKRTMASVPELPKEKSDEDTPFLRRRFDYLEYYFNGLEEERRKLCDFLDFPLVNIDFHYLKNSNAVGGEIYKIDHPKGESGQEDFPLAVIDLLGDEYLAKSAQDKHYIDIRDLIDSVKGRFKLLIIAVPQSCHFPVERVDMMIELHNTPDTSVDYLNREVRIPYSRRQAVALGRHIYKYRDYGLEFFPSLHLYFQQRRYLQRALIYTHSSVVADTYQQYMSRAAKYLDRDDPMLTDKLKGYTFDAYQNRRDGDCHNTVEQLYEDYSIGQSAVDVLEAILFPTMVKAEQKQDRIQYYKGSMTAVIGSSNTYKRFLTFGSIFSSSLNKEHTLVVLFNKDSDTTLRRLACPARAKCGKDCTHCHECYKYIHFMDINMGNITPEEFLFFLKKHIDTKYEDGKRIKRVVIDDMQIMDYCYPYLLKSNLFLSALRTICKDKGVYSYILCDKSGEKSGELRAVADNIICMGHNNKGRLQIHIERFIGFHNTPSKIYCCIVEKVKDLFECYYKMETGENKHWYYRLNSLRMDDGHVVSMDEFWKR